jgi:hypothetical protein
MNSNRVSYSKPKVSHVQVPKGGVSLYRSRSNESNNSGFLLNESISNDLTSLKMKLEQMKSFKIEE